MTANNVLLQKRQLVGLLEWACQKLELTETQANDAAARYKSVGEWLAVGEHPWLANATIYPQGSVRLQTTVKPIGRLEFDVDLVCELPQRRGSAPRTFIGS